MLFIACILLVGLSANTCFTPGYRAARSAQSASRLYKIPPFKVPGFDFGAEKGITVKDRVATTTEKMNSAHETQVSDLRSKNTTMSSVKDTNDKDLHKSSPSPSQSPSQDDEEDEDDISIPSKSSAPKLETRKSRQAAEEWRRQNDPNYTAPISIYREELVKEWSFSDSLNINSTTLRALLDFQGEVINFFTKISKGFETISVVVASKVERDLRTVGLSTDYINRRTSKEIKKLFGGKEVDPNEVGGRFTLPSSVSSDRQIERMESSLQALNPFTADKEKKSKLIGGFNKGTTTSERLRKKKEKDRGVKSIASGVTSKATMGADGIYRSVKVLPKKLSYDYERRKLKREMEENAWKSRQSSDANIKQIGESVNVIDEEQEEEVSLFQEAGEDVVEMEPWVLDVEPSISPSIELERKEEEEEGERVDEMVIGRDIDDTTTIPLMFEEKEKETASDVGAAGELEEVYAYWSEPRNADLLTLLCYIGGTADSDTDKSAVGEVEGAVGDDADKKGEKESLLVMEVVSEIETDLSFLSSQLSSISPTLASKLSVSLPTKINMVTRAQTSIQRVTAASSTALRLLSNEYELVVEESLLRLNGGDARHVKDGLWLLGEVLTQVKTDLNIITTTNKGDDGDGEEQSVAELSSLVTSLSSYVLTRKDGLLFAFKLLDRLDRQFGEMDGSTILEERREALYSEEEEEKEMERVSEMEVGNQVDLSQFVAASAFDDDDDEEVDINIAIDRDDEYHDDEGVWETRIISATPSSGTSLDLALGGVSSSSNGGERETETMVIDTDAAIVAESDMTGSVVSFLLQSFDVTLFLTESLVKAAIPVVKDGGKILARRYKNVFSKEYNVKYIPGAKSSKTSLSSPSSGMSNIKNKSKGGEDEDGNTTTGAHDNRQAKKEKVYQGNWVLVRGVADAKADL